MPEQRLRKTREAYGEKSAFGLAFRVMAQWPRVAAEQQLNTVYGNVVAPITDDPEEPTAETPWGV